MKNEIDYYNELKKLDKRILTEIESLLNQTNNNFTNYWGFKGAIYRILREKQNACFKKT